MGKNRYEKGLRPQQRKNLKLPKPLPAVVDKPKNWWQKIAPQPKKLIVLAVSISTLVVSYYTCKNENLSQKEKFDKEKTYQGDLKFPLESVDETSIERYNTILSNAVIDSLKQKKALPNVRALRGIYIKNFEASHLILAVGDSRSFQPAPVYEGGFNAFTFTNGCATGELMVKEENDRLYISLKILDLNTGFAIGNIQYNHWTLFAENKLYWNDSDTSLTVWDSKYNVALSVKYSSEMVPALNQGPAKVLYISGYFVSPKSVLVLDSKNNKKFCFLNSEINYKENALIEIEKLKEIH